MFFKKSPWIIHYDATSCNGCDIEVIASLTPMYDLERFGIINTGNPKHADIFVVTGSVNESSRTVVRNIYDQMPNPKVVVAVGICATSGGVFQGVLQCTRRRRQGDTRRRVCARMRGPSGVDHRRHNRRARYIGKKTRRIQEGESEARRQENKLRRYHLND